MKKLSLIILGLSLLVMVSSNVLAIDHFDLNLLGYPGNYDFDPTTFDYLEIAGNSYPRMDSWYSIKPEQENLKVSYLNLGDSGDFGARYFLNDQTFISYISGDTSYFSGSYLFDSGLFVGLTNIKDNDSDDADDSTTYIYPGFRLNFGDNSYFLFKYAAQTEDSDESFFAVKVKHYGNNVYLKSSIIQPSRSGSDSIFNMGINYLATDALVVGLNYTKIGPTSAFDMGCTLGNPNSAFIIDAQYGRYSDNENFYVFSGMYKIVDNLRIGAEYYQLDLENVDAQISLKAKYNTEKKQFALKYSLENDSFNAMYFLSFQKNF
ncbi:MAG: hypothetical protein ACM3YE_13485 [Bacteroidota bacterium]